MRDEMLVPVKACAPTDLRLKGSSIEVRPVERKALDPMDSRAGGKATDVSEVRPLAKSFGRLVTAVAERSSDVRQQLDKAREPTRANVLGSAREASPLPSKAYRPMETRFGGKVTEVSAEQPKQKPDLYGYENWKTEPPKLERMIDEDDTHPSGMLVMLEAERSSETSLVQSLNTSWPVEVTEEGSTNEVRPVLKKAAEPM